MRTLGFIFLAFAVLVNPAVSFAGKDDPEWNPPARFDHPFDGTLKVIRVPVQDVSKTCEAMRRFFGGKALLGSPNHGCAKRKDDDLGPYCVVVIPRGSVQLAAPEAVLRHEVGHCNGWPSGHPD